MRNIVPDGNYLFTLQQFHISIHNVLCEKGTGSDNLGTNSTEGYQNEDLFARTHKLLRDKAHYACENSEIILVSHVCDGSGDCTDGSDEINCTVQTQGLMFKCNSGESIHVSKHCNFKTDCLDGSDEFNCIHPSCKDEEFMCSNGQCINTSYRCDLEINCLDKSDEMGCGSLPICPDFTCLSRDCINSKYLGDGVKDCPGLFGEDESEEHQKNTCAEGFKRCDITSTPCFESNKLCVYDRDSLGNLKHCRKGEHIQGCSNFTCQSSKYFKCPESYCIPVHKVCDGVKDCTDGYDEKNCQNFSCPGFFRCKYDNTCVHPSHICDGIIHCPISADDETFCDLRTKACQQGCICEGYLMKCENMGLLNIPNYSSQIRGLGLRKNNLVISGRMFQHLPLLSALDLSENQISLLHVDTFANLANLVLLDLSGNLINSFTSGTFRQLHNLKELILLDNPILKIFEGSFDGLYSLSSLVLNKMRIGHLEDNCFGDLGSLTLLDLSYNKLATLPPMVFEGLRGLERLDVTGNRLVNVNMTTFITLPDELRIRASSFHVCCYVKYAIHCEPREDVFSSCDNLLGTSSLRMLMWIIGSLAFFGNLLLLVLSVFKIYEIKGSKNSIIVQLWLASGSLMGSYIIAISIMDEVYKGIFHKMFSFWTNHFACKFLRILFSVSFGLINWGTVVTAYALQRGDKLSKFFTATFFMILGFMYFVLDFIVGLKNEWNDIYTGMCMPTMSPVLSVEWVVMFWASPAVALIAHLLLFVYNVSGDTSYVDAKRKNNRYFLVLGIGSFLPWLVFFVVSIGKYTDINVQALGFLSLLIPSAAMPFCLLLA